MKLKIVNKIIRKNHKISYQILNQLSILNIFEKTKLNILIFGMDAKSLSSFQF